MELPVVLVLVDPSETEVRVYLDGNDQVVYAPDYVEGLKALAVPTLNGSNVEIRKGKIPLPKEPVSIYASV